MKWPKWNHRKYSLTGTSRHTMKSPTRYSSRTHIDLLNVVSEYTISSMESSFNNLAGLRHISNTAKIKPGFQWGRCVYPAYFAVSEHA
jgi:hypothetical protein